MKVLPRKFYMNDTKQVAKDLLGKTLVRKIGNQVLSGVIIETEAYKGKNEDLYGEPFIGTAGKRLDDALKNAGLTRNSVYITNIVKCRPPENRIPNDVEKSMCNEYLKDEIAIINPKIICLLGNTPFYSILGGKEISKNHGKFISKDNRMYFVTFHPAATIYNQKLVNVFKNDISKLVKKLQKLKTNSVD